MSPRQEIGPDLERLDKRLADGGFQYQQQLRWYPGPRARLKEKMTSSQDIPCTIIRVGYTENLWFRFHSLSEVTIYGERGLRECAYFLRHYSHYSLHEPNGCGQMFSDNWSQYRTGGDERRPSVYQFQQTNHLQTMSCRTNGSQNTLFYGMLHPLLP